MPGPAPLVRVVRSGFVESFHRGDVAVCDAQGRLLSGVGDTERPVFTRSCLKPLQAAVSLGRVGTELPDELVAIMCASHNGEPAHTRAVRRLLRVAGARETQLGCPPDLPARRADAARVSRPRRVFHNCSGKHAGMVAACISAGWPVESYLEPSHPLQRDVRTALRRAAGLSPLAVGVDGCGVPTFGLPLSAVATLFARLAVADRLGPLAPFVERAVAAMGAHPFLVAGTRRADTLLMGVAPNVVSKGGAEGLACAAVLDRGIGVAVKIADGGDRAAAPALLRALSLLDVLTEAQLERLAPLARRPVLGGGRPVGELAADFRLRRPRG